MRPLLSVRRGMFLLTLVALIAPRTATAQEEEGAARPQFSVSIKVSAASGGDVDACEAFLLAPEGYAITKSWVAGARGEIRLSTSDLTDNAVARPPVGKAQLLVRAAGHCGTIETIELPAVKPLAVKLPKGQRVELHVKAPPDMTLPADLEPVVFGAGQHPAVWLKAAGWKRGDAALASVPNLALTKPIGEGRFAFEIEPGSSDLYVMISHPGFLRAYQAGPFTPETVRSGKLEISLPRPGRIAATFKPKDGAAEQPYTDCGLGAFVAVPLEGAGYYGFLTHEHHGVSTTCTWDDLAPGRYLVDGFTGTKATRYDRNQPGYFRDQRNIQLAAADSQDIAFEFEAFDEAAFKENLKGDRGVVLTISRQDGQPVADKPYKLTTYARFHAREVVAYEGTTDTQGRITLSGMAGGDQAPHLQVEVDGAEVGSIWLGGDEKQHEIALKLPPGVGDVAPDLRLHDISTGHSLKLSDFRGQVVFIDFWATWCGPCQEPMKHNSEITARRAKDWAGKAVILGLSIDDAPDLVVKHCRTRGWDNLRQLWCGDGEKKGWGCEAVEVYGIRGVPTALLLDSNGKIVWRGHPASFKVEEEIDKLLKTQ